MTSSCACTKHQEQQREQLSHSTGRLIPSGEPICRKVRTKIKAKKNPPSLRRQNQVQLAAIFTAKVFNSQGLSRARESAPPPRHVRFCQPAAHQAYPRQLPVEQATVVRLKMQH